MPDSPPERPAAPARSREAPVPLPPVDYPWDPTTTAGIVGVDGFTPVDPDDLDRRLRAARATGLGERQPVIGVGSNRNAEVLRSKFLTAGITPTLALTPLTVDGLAVGHSAHVSRRGYVAAAPFAAPGVRTELTVAWLDDLQLEALDDTEPNYQRIAFAWGPSRRPAPSFLGSRAPQGARSGGSGPSFLGSRAPQGAGSGGSGSSFIGGRVPRGVSDGGSGPSFLVPQRSGDGEPAPDSAEDPEGSWAGGPQIWWVYRSRWGLIADGEPELPAPLPLGTQATVQARLRTVPGLTGAWADGLTAAEVTGRLADPALRERIREALIVADVVLPSGLGEPSGL